MDTLWLVVACAIVCACEFFYSKRSKFPHLRGPSFRQYLPNGVVFPIFKDTSRMLTTINILSRIYGPVYQIWLGPIDTVITSVPSDIAQILSATKIFIRPKAMDVMFETAVPGSLMVAQRDAHLAMRNHFRERFNYSILPKLHEDIVEAGAELCEALMSMIDSEQSVSNPFNVCEQFAVTTFRVITNVAFGWNLGRDERLQLAKCTDRLVDEMMLDFVCYPLRRTFASLGFRDKLIESREEVRSICRTLVEQRLGETDESKKSRSFDLLDAIIGLEGQNLIAIISHVIVFIVAGAHTTQETLAWSVFEISRNPAVATAVRNELADLFGDTIPGASLLVSDVQKLRYLKNVWKETLRMHPPGPILAREAVKDVTLAGSKVFIPAGTTLVANTHGSHRDPMIWSDPDQFMPERWSSPSGESLKVPPGSYAPYSIGARNCAGRFLGDYEGIYILAEVYRKFEFELACQPERLHVCRGWQEQKRNIATGNSVIAGIPMRVRLR